MRAEKRRTIVPTRRLEDHTLSTAERNVRGGALVRHTACEAENIGQSRILVGVPHEARAAECRTALRVVDGENGVVRGVGILRDPDFLVAGDTRRLEFRELE